MRIEAPHERGFTLVEMVIGAALAAALMVVVGVVVVQGRRATTESGARYDVDAELRTVLARIADEARCSSRAAEDVNTNKILDSGEDTNGNGRLDADWNVTASSIVFNRLGADGKYSLPIAYSVVGTKLVRTTTLTVAGKTQKTDVASNVKSFAVSDSGGKVTIDLRVSRKSAGGATVDKTTSITVAPRN